jgi:hypothetical protein
MKPDTLSPAASSASAAKEPSTKFGQFYRAHRPEVLAGGGAVVAAIAYWKSKHGSSSTSSTSSQIDPATGQVAGSAADEAALAQQSGAGVTSSGILPSGGDGSTGYSGSGYGGDGGGGSDIATELGTIETTLTGDQTLLQGLTPTSGPDPEMPANPAPGSPSVATKRTAAQAEAITTKNLAKDKAAEKSNPSAKNAAAVKNLTARLGKEKG